MTMIAVLHQQGRHLSPSIVAGFRFKPRWRADIAGSERSKLSNKVNELGKFPPPCPASLAKSLLPLQERASGEMAEWLKAHAWKACVRETVPWVRIPLSPPSLNFPRWTTIFYDFVRLLVAAGAQIAK